MRKRKLRGKHLIPHFEQLQVDYPNEKRRYDGYLYPRFSILEKGDNLYDETFRKKREAEYKKLVKKSPERVLINPEKEKYD